MLPRHKMVQKNVLSIMKRLVFERLKVWKDSEGRKPLVLNGARQVGKTWLLHEFARTQYEKEAYINCRKNEIAQQIFSTDFDVERILRALRALSGVDITPNDTLIILDEIQEIPEALESLKYFRENAHQVISANDFCDNHLAGTDLAVSYTEEVVNKYPHAFTKRTELLDRRMNLQRVGLGNDATLLLKPSVRLAANIANPTEAALRPYINSGRSMRVIVLETEE